MLRPVESSEFYRSVRNVRVYLDDIQNIVSNLSDHGNVKITVTHAGGTKSDVGSVNDLAGRKDIESITLELARGAAALIRIGDLSGVDIAVDKTHRQVYPVCEHFLSTLEPARPTLRYRLRSMLGQLQLPYVDVRLENRLSVQQKRERLKLELVSGLIGAVIGAAVAIVALLLGGE